MKMEYVFEQGSGIFNEDCLIAHDHIFGVFDGATSLSKVALNNGKSGGLRASTIAAQTFLGANAPLASLGVMANNSIRKEMQSCGLDFSRRFGLWSTSAAVVRVGNKDIEWFQTGDAQIIFIYKDGGYKIAARGSNHDYTTLSMIREKGRYHPNVLKMIKDVREDMNRSYGVLNGEEEAECFFNLGTQDLQNIKTVLLFTDGLEIPSLHPQKHKDFSSLVHMSQELGLRGLHDYVRHEEKSDPHIEAFPRFKQHDDIAAIALHL